MKNSDREVASTLNKRARSKFIALVAGAITAGVLVTWEVALSNGTSGREGNIVVFQINKPNFPNSNESFEQTVRYEYTTRNVSAELNKDFYVVGGNNGYISFPAGQNTKATLSVALVADEIDEGDGEKYQLVLTEPRYNPAANMWLYGFYLPKELVFDGLILERN